MCNQKLTRLAGSCLLLLLLYLPCDLTAQVRIAPDEDNISDLDNFTYVRPGVRNRSLSKGVELRHEVHGSFNWTALDGRLGNERQEVDHVERTTFKFKIPLANQPDFKMLLGYEWNTEKYHFDFDPGEPARNLWSRLDETRLKINKFSAYFTKAWNEKAYTTLRLRLSTNGDHDGLVSFADPYRTYSAAAGYGVKPREDKEWGIGLTVSHNRVRTVVIPFLIYNITWNERWGFESALPASAYLRYNFGPDHALLVGGNYDSKMYAINWEEDRSSQNAYWVRNGGFKVQAHYERHLFSWIYWYAEAGYYLPVNSRFNPISDPDLTLEAEVTGRPIARIGLFLTPPKDMIR